MKYDIAIIGGGPAGLMAAVASSQLGAKVVLVEKNQRLGIKLLLTGGTRCNLTNEILDPRAFISRLGAKAKFLFSALTRFGVADTLEFFHALGLKTKVENDQRVFPLSNKAEDVLAIFMGELKKYQVKVETQSEVKKFIKKNQHIEKIILTDGREIEADKYILATGGKSYPKTGSSGDGYGWLKQLGHTVILPTPSLTPLTVVESFVKDLEGLSVEAAKLSLYQGTKKITSAQGDIIFTANGLSGPLTLDLSRQIDTGKLNNLFIEVDFMPLSDLESLDKKLQQVLAASSKQVKNSLDGFVLPKLKSVILKLGRINPEKKSNLISRQERLSLVKLLKGLMLKIKGLAGFERAMITKGGVALNEIEPQTMRSKKINNLFICGEILDLDGPTGGFNLQICWTTGFVAGQSAQKDKSFKL